MKEIILSITNRLASQAPNLKYISPDWGQLDYYSDHPPVQWPCALVDVAQAQYSNLADNAQLADLTVMVRIAALPLTNSSMQAPAGQKGQALAWWQLIRDVHEALQGYTPQDDCTPLLRTTGRRMRRDDGVMLWEVTYTTSQTDIMPDAETAPKPTLRILQQIVT